MLILQHKEKIFYVSIKTAKWYTNKEYRYTIRYYLLCISCIKIERDVETAKEIVLNCANKNEALYNYVCEGRMLSMNNIMKYISQGN